MPPTSSPRWIHCLTLVSIGLASSLVPLHSRAEVPVSGTFTATQPCPATQAINGQNPGNVQLTVGKEYEAVGFNSAERKFVLLKILAASPNRRWVNTNCGTLRQAEDSPSDTSDSNTGDQSATGLLPFFDQVDNPVPVDFPRGAQKDITPPPPQLEPFDQKILALCGAGFGADVDSKKFNQLISYYPDVVRKLKQTAGGSLKSNRQTDAAFIDDLEALWFDKKGFKHVFCGEKDGNSIGGLHFVGRYLQLQQEKIAGRLVTRNTTEEVIDGSIYTFGVVIKQGDRVIAQHPIKGYSYVLNAQEILLNAVKAFKQFKPQNVAKDACLFTVTEPQTAPFQAVFVEENAAIRTFYPDATPDSKTKSCSS